MSGVVEEHDGAEAGSDVGGRRSRLRRFTSNVPATIAVGFLLMLVLIAIAAPLIARHDPNAQDLRNVLQPPSRANWLGTDEFGRDQLTRLMYGARVSLIAAVIATSVAVGIGLPLGMLAGYVGRKTDAVLTWFNDGLMSVPSLVLAFAIIAVLGFGLTNAMIAIGLVTVPSFFRVARASTINVAAETFVEGLRSLGCPSWRIVRAHVLPNALSPTLVQASVTLGRAVTAEASLSFLGIGVRPPAASWGNMLSTANRNMRDSAYLLWPPGLMIALTVLAFTLLGDGLRDAFGAPARGSAR